MPDKSPYTIKVAKSGKEVEEIRNIWEKLQCHPNADIDFYLNIVNSREEIIRPHVIILYSGETPKAMMIGRIEERTIDLKIGYKTICKPKVLALAVIHGGILGDISPDIADALTSELIASLDQGEADIVFLSNIRVDSSIYKMAQEKPIFLCREYLIISNLHWKMSVPSAIDEFLKKLKSKHRYWMRRTKRLLEKDFEGKIAIRSFHDSGRLDKLCKDAEEIAKETYQRGLGAGFIDNDENRKRLHLSADRGWLRAYIMYNDEKPIAFWIGAVYQKTFYSKFTGYNQEYKKYEPGTIIFMKMLEDLCQDDVDGFDFGLGDAFYKKRFGDTNWEEAVVYIFAPTLKGILLNIIRTITILISMLFEKILDRFNLKDKMKKKWRRKVARS